MSKYERVEISVTPAEKERFSAMLGSANPDISDIVRDGLSLPPAYVLEAENAVESLKRLVRNLSWASAVVVALLVASLTAATLKLRNAQANLKAVNDKVAQLVKGNATPAVDDTELLAIIAERSNINQQDLSGRTILHEAVRNRSDLATFDFLISQGADLNKRAYGFEMNGSGKRDAAILGLTPVMAAMFAGSVDKQADEITLHLLAHHGDRIDFTLETRHGLTLLAIALKRLQDQPKNRVLLNIVEICKMNSNNKG